MAGKPIKITLLADNSNALRGINAVANRLGVLSRISQAAGRALARSARVGFLATAAGAAFLVKKVYDVNSALQRSGVAFKFLFKEAGGAATAMASVRDIAANSPFPVDQLSIYTKQLAGAGNTAADADKKLRIILDTTAAFGSTQEQTGRAILALTQIQSKSTVQAEELNQLAEAGVPAYKALAEATGKSIPELRKLGQQGKLLSADVLPLLYAQLQKNYGGALVQQSATLSGRLNTLKNRSLFLLSDAFQPLFDYLNSKLPGAIAGMTRIIPKIGEQFAKLPAILDAAVASVRAWSSEFNAAVERVTGRDVLGNIKGALKGGKVIFEIGFKVLGNDVGQAVLATLALMILQWKALSAAINTASAAQRTFAALAAKGPLVGVTAAVAAATIGFIHFRNEGYSVINSLKLVGTTAVEAMARAGTVIVGAAEAFGIYIGELLKITGQAAAHGFLIPFREIAGQLGSLLDKLPGAIKPDGLVNALKSFGQTSGFAFGDSLQAANDKGVAAFNKRINSIPLDTNKALAGLPAIASKAGTSTGAALAAGIQQKVPVAIAAARSVGTQVGKTLAATQDPAQRAGERASSAYASGVGSGKGQATAQGHGLGTGAVGGATSGGAPMSGVGGSTGARFSSGMRSSYGAASSAGSGLSASAASGAKGSTGLFSSIGANLGHALASGMRAAQGAVSSAASALVGIANKAARAVAKIHSPSKLFEEIGRFMTLGLIEGLTKDKESLKSTATQLAQLVSETAKSVAEERAGLFSTATEKRGELITAQRALGEARKAKAGAKEIKAAQTSVEKASKAYLAAIGKVAEFDKSAAVKAISNPKTRAAAQQLIAEFANSMNKILTARESIAARLEVANEKLSDAIQVRDQFKEKLTEAAKDFASLSSLSFEDLEGNKVAPTSNGIQQQLQARLDLIKKFTTQAEQLTQQGLNKDLLQQILEMGPEAGSSYAQAILEGGAAGISGLNNLQTQINGAADKLGTFGSTVLFQSGVDSAQALVNGLLGQQKQLEDTATRLAQAFAAQFKKMLGITAPALLPIEQLFNTQAQATGNGAVVRPSTVAPQPATSQQLTIRLVGGTPNQIDAARQTIEQLQAYGALNGAFRLPVVSTA